MKIATASVMKLARCTFLICLWSGVIFAQSRPVDSGLTTHEWGSFTSVAGGDGQAVEWTPLSLRNADGELTGVVEHPTSRRSLQGASGTNQRSAAALTVDQGKAVTGDG